MSHSATYAAVQAIARTYCHRFDGMFEYGPRNDDGYEVFCRRGERWGRSVISQKDILARAHDAGGLVELVANNIRWAWQAAGGGALNVPFRIGTRSPKRLQIAKETAA